MTMWTKIHTDHAAPIRYRVMGRLYYYATKISLGLRFDLLPDDLASDVPSLPSAVTLSTLLDIRDPGLCLGSHA